MHRSGRTVRINYVVFFFFKQKTAYEIRKGDWSSDVCSSDLGGIPLASSSSTTPSTDRQRKSPVSRLIAVRNPHGGFWHGLRSLSQKRELGLPDPWLRYGTSDPSG